MKIRALLQPWLYCWVDFPPFDTGGDFGPVSGDIYFITVITPIMTAITAESLFAAVWVTGA